MFALKSKPIESPLLGLRFKEQFLIRESILLAASMDTASQILDLGMGTGITSLCVAQRLPETIMIGLEANREHLKIINENIEINDMKNRIQAFHCDFLSPPPRLAAGTFSQVMVNSFCLEGIPVSLWVKFALLMTRPLGELTCLIRISELDELMHLLFKKLGKILLFPIWPSKGEESQMFILKGIKGAASSVRLLPGLMLYNETHVPLSEAEAILKKGAPLNLHSR